MPKRFELHTRPGTAIEEREIVSQARLMQIADNLPVGETLTVTRLADGEIEKRPNPKRVRSTLV